LGGRGKICQRIPYSLGGTSIYSSAFWTCCLLDFESKGWGAGNALETSNLLFQFIFSHRHSTRTYLFSPTPLCYIFPILPPNIYSIPFNFPLFGELRVFLFLRKRKIREFCEGRASQIVYFGFNFFLSVF